METTCCSSFCPVLPASLNPALTITAPETPASPHSRMTSGTWGAGTAMTARSTLRGTWPMEAYACTPWIAGAVRLTGKTMPSYSAPMRLRNRM